MPYFTAFVDELRVSPRRHGNGGLPLLPHTLFLSINTDTSSVRRLAQYRKKLARPHPGERSWSSRSWVLRSRCGRFRTRSESEQKPRELMKYHEGDCPYDRHGKQQEDTVDYLIPRSTNRFAISQELAAASWSQSPTELRP